MHASKFVPILVFAAAAFLARPQPAAATSHKIAGGDWVEAGHRVAGTWSIIRDGDDRYIVLSKDFETANAPDLKLFLSPKPASKLTDDNATTGSIKIAKLRKTKGGQRYKLPARLDLDDYRSLALHCERYSKLFGKADLSDG